MGAEKSELAKGKRRWTLIPWKMMGWIVDAMCSGLTKYKAESWKDVENGENYYYDALLRHITEYREALEDGNVKKEFDDQSGLHHLAHAGCNSIIVLWFAFQRINKSGKRKYFEEKTTLGDNEQEAV